MILNRPRALVEQIDKDYVVLLISPTGSRDYYVETGISEAGEVTPYVTDNTDKAKKFGHEHTAKAVAGDMQAFLNRQYSNLVKWH